MFHSLTTIDYAIVIAFFACLVGIGLYFKRMASESLEHYFLGGRRIPWWAMGMAGMTSMFDMSGTMLITSFLFLLGPRGLLIELRGGVALLLIAMVLFTGKWHRRSGCMTGAEWMEFRFGSGFGGQLARIASALAILTGATAALAYLIIGAGQFLAPFFGWEPKYCSAVIILVATVYTLTSGFYGVVVSDIFQGAIMLVACVIMGVWGAYEVYHRGSLAQTAEAVTGMKDWMSCLPSWRIDMSNLPPGDYQHYQFLIPMLGFIMIQKVLEALNSGVDPRFFGARNDRECGTLAFTWQTLLVFRWPLMIGFAVLGLYTIHSLYPDKAVWQQAADTIKLQVPSIDSKIWCNDKGAIDKARWGDGLADLVKNPQKYPAIVSVLEQEKQLGPQWQKTVKWVSYDGAFNPEAVLPAVIMTKMGPGLLGFIITALLAASMSTFNAMVNGGAAYWTRDLYQRYIRPRAGRRELLLSTYGFIVVMVSAAFVMAYTTKSINEIWSWITMGLGAALSMGLLRFYWWRFNGGGLAASIFTGIVTALGYKMLTRYVDLHGLTAWQWLADERWQFCILTGIAILAALLGTYLTRPTDPKVVENFYRKTKPFGFWGRYKKLLAPAERKAMEREHFYDLAAVPFTSVYHVCLLLTPVLLIIGSYKALSVVVFLGLGGLAGMYYLWYRHLPAEEKPAAAPTVEPLKKEAPVPR